MACLWCKRHQAQLREASSPSVAIQNVSANYNALKNLQTRTRVWNDHHIILNHSLSKSQILKRSSGLD